MSWLLAFLGFSALIVLHEFGHFIAAKRVGMKATRFFLFFPPKVVSVKRGETEYGVGAIPLGGFVKIIGMNPEEELDDEDDRERAYYRQPVWKRIVVISAGPAVNLLIAFAIFFALALGQQEVTDRVGEIRSDTPAAQSLQEGDRILAVDGADVTGLEEADRRLEIAELVNEHECAGAQTDGCLAEDPARLRVERDGEVQTIAVRPEFDASQPGFTEDEEGRMLLGFSYGTRAASNPPGESATLALDQMWTITSQGIFGIFPRLFEGEGRDEISGVVGIYETTRQAFEFDARTALNLLGAISLVLAVFNLFPFLPLDGGHIAWALAEKVKGRRVSLATMARFSSVGIVFLVLLVAIGLTNDIDRLTGEGFDLR